MLNLSVVLIKDGKEVYKMERAKKKNMWKAIIIAAATIGSFLLGGEKNFIVNAVETAAIEVVEAN